MSTCTAPNCTAPATDTLPDTGAACCRHHLIMRSIELDPRPPKKGIEIGRSDFIVSVTTPPPVLDAGPDCDFCGGPKNRDAGVVACSECGWHGYPSPGPDIDVVRLDS